MSSPTKEVHEFKESTPYIGVSEWRCQKLKQEKGKTQRWSKDREEMKRENLER